MTKEEKLAKLNEVWSNMPGSKCSDNLEYALLNNEDNAEVAKLFPNLKEHELQWDEGNERTVVMSYDLDENTKDYVGFTYTHDSWDSDYDHSDLMYMKTETKEVWVGI